MVTQPGYLSASATLFDILSRKISLLLLLCALGATCAHAQGNAYAFGATGAMVTTRSQHTATLLNDGTVLVTGGNVFVSSTIPPTFVATAEIFDPTTGTFAATGSMAAARSSHTATPLQNGKILIAGGQNSSGVLESAALYDPSTGTFSATGNMNAPRSYHTATMLPDGKVLLVGGAGSNGSVTSAEIYDPATGTFTATGSMATARSTHTATVLPTGKVLIAGGSNNSIAQLTSAEIYDPSTGMFSATGNMTNPRSSHTATLLSTGKVLVAGGFGVTTAGCEESPVWNTAELYDPTVGTFTPTGNMIEHRYLHTATLLNNNLVLLAAGDQGPTFNPDCGLEYPPTLDEAELYDPTAGTFAQTATLVSYREWHTATLLNDGTVLIAGGAINDGSAPAPTPSAELFETAFGTVGPPYLSFGNQAVGTQSPVSQHVTLLNAIAGMVVTNAINITQVTISGLNPSDFTQTNNCLGNVAVSAQCTVQVTFAPSAIGLRQANIVIVNNNDSTHAMKVPLAGTGVPFVAPTATVSVSPTSLSFSPQYVGTSSAQQTVTVTNISSSSVTIASVEPSSADYVIVNNCLSPLPANGTCTVLVSFDPTTSGVRSGTITFNDNSPTGFQSVGLTGVSGTGQDFSMAAGSGGGATVSPGQTATYSLALAPGGGFAQSVGLTCSGGPAMSTCSVSPSSITLNGTASQTATVSVATSGQGVSPIPSDFGGNIRRQMPLILVQAMTLFVFLIWMASRQWRWRYSSILALVALLCVAMSLSSCGGGSTGTSNANSASQSGTYTITVTGNFTSGAANLKHTTKFTLVVQ